MTVRTVVIGCVEFSARMFGALTRIPEIEIAGVVTRKTSSVNSDFHSLASLAERQEVSAFLADGKDQEALGRYIEACRADLALCVGWSSLLPPSVIALPKWGVIGYHPAALPRNRGRHPLVWALALGLRETASTFFLMTEKADAGPILDQRPVAIEPDENAASLYEKVTATAETQLPDFLPRYVHGSLVSVPQCDEMTNSWRKRSSADGRVDWRMTFDAIHNLVRALAPPYPGATFYSANLEYRLWRVERGPDAPSNLEPGKVIAVDGHRITVKCWNGSVVLVEHTLEMAPKAGDYIW